MSDICVRIPPSPTGLLHIGTVRTALYNFLFARQKGGKIIMRMEDTDKERSTKEYEDDILSGLQNLGITWDGEVIRQSERTGIYKKHLQQLIDEDKAYWCFCTKEELEAKRKERESQKLPPRYAGTCSALSQEDQKKRIEEGEKAVLRFRISENAGDIFFQDEVRGEVIIHAKELDDFVIAKDLETPLYNFCVVVDDYEMNISHVIRGEDHISNTPKQILLFQAFGWGIPHFAHLPLILNQDKSKLSKRKNKVSVDDYLSEGFLPESLINFLALLGWNTSDEQEIFSLSELMTHFSLDRVHKGGAVFDLEKLLWLNGYYIRQKSLEEFAHIAAPFLRLSLFQEGKEKYGEGFFQSALALVQERTKKLSELPDFLRFFFLSDADLSYDRELYVHKKMKTTVGSSREALEFSLEWIDEFVQEWKTENLKEYFFEKIKEKELKNGGVLWPLRVALSGEQFSPGTFELLEVFGKKRSLARIKRGIALLSV